MSPNVRVHVVPGLPPYRRVSFIIAAQIGDMDSEELAAHLVDGLRPFGVPRITTVTVLPKGEAWFYGDIDPPGSTAECMAAVRAVSPDRWAVDLNESYWLQRDNPMPFLHPSVDEVSLGESDAPTLPKFAEGDQVRVLDCAQATRDGLVGTVGTVRVSLYTHVDETWLHTIRVPDRNGPFQFRESELEPVT